MLGTVSIGGIIGLFCAEGLNDGASGVLAGSGAAGAGAGAGAAAGRDDCCTGRGRLAGLLNGLLS